MPHREKYERAWRQIHDLAAGLVDAGEHDLSRVVRLVEAEWRSMDASPAPGIAFGERITLPRAALIGGRRDLVMRVLIAQCTPQTQMVVELGSGWGHNLLNLYLAGGPRVPYYALEPSESGRATAGLLAALAPELELRTLPFEFRDAPYDLPADNEHVLVFTAHSIEQVRQLPRGALTGLFRLGRSVTCVHFEPIGWHLREDSLAESSRRHGARRHYNENLWALLDELERSGDVVVDEVVPDIIGHKDRNPSTLVVWRTASR